MPVKIEGKYTGQSLPSPSTQVLLGRGRALAPNFMKIFFHPSIHKHTWLGGQTRGPKYKRSYLVLSVKCERSFMQPDRGCNLSCSPFGQLCFLHNLRRQLTELKKKMKRRRLAYENHNKVIYIYIYRGQK